MDVNGYGFAKPPPPHPTPPLSEIEATNAAVRLLFRSLKKKKKSCAKRVAGPKSIVSLME